MNLIKKQRGFTLLELLIVVAIIGILVSIILPTISSARIKARDAKRKTEISSIGRLITASCYLPSTGAGEYDIADIVAEFASNNTQYASYISQIPKDPSATSETKSLYMYTVNADSDCAVYANLENKNDTVTLPNISTPTPRGGIGVFEATSNGWNGTAKYFQVSN